MHFGPVHVLPVNLDVLIDGSCFLPPIGHGGTIGNGPVPMVPVRIQD